MEDSSPNCILCGGPLPPYKGGRRRKYCGESECERERISQRHRKWWGPRQNRDWREVLPPEILALPSGHPDYLRACNRIKRLEQAEQMGMEVRDGVIVRYYLCSFCGEVFEAESRSGGLRYCSDAHRRAAQAKRSAKAQLSRKAAPRTRRERATAEKRRLARNQAYREKYATDREFRLSELAKARLLYRSPSGDRVRAYNALKSALKRGSPYGEHFDPWEVFERDGWICHLCGLPVDRSARKGRGPSSGQGPSLDHLIPCSKQGPHTRENTACAHLSCNSHKRVRLTSEVPRFSSDAPA